MLALEWADTVRRPRKLTHDPRRARPDAVNLPRMSEQRLRHGTSGQTPRWSAGRRAGPVMAGHLWPGLAGDGPYREAGHGCARTTRTSVSLRSIPLGFPVGDEKGRRRQPARHHKRAAQRWLARGIPRRDEVASPESITPGQENGMQTERR